MSEVLAAITHRLSEEYGKIELKSDAAKTRMVADVALIANKLGPLSEAGKTVTSLETVVKDKTVPKRSVGDNLKGMFAKKGKEEVKVDPKAINGDKKDEQNDGVAGQLGDEEDEDQEKEDRTAAEETAAKDVNEKTPGKEEEKAVDEETKQIAETREELEITSPPAEASQEASRPKTEEATVEAQASTPRPAKAAEIAKSEESPPPPLPEKSEVATATATGSAAPITDPLQALSSDATTGAELKSPARSDEPTGAADGENGTAAGETAAKEHATS